MGRGLRWDEAAMAAALEAVIDGVSYRRAAGLTGIPESTIRKRAAAGGLVRRCEAKRGGVALAESVVRPALEAVARGVSAADAAAAAGIDVSTLRRRIREHGAHSCAEFGEQVTVEPWVRG